MFAYIFTFIHGIYTYIYINMHRLWFANINSLTDIMEMTIVLAEYLAAIYILNSDVSTNLYHFQTVTEND